MRAKILQVIQQIYDYGVDVVTAIKDGQHINFDKLQPIQLKSLKIDLDAKQAEEETINAEFKFKIKRHVNHGIQYEINCPKVFSLIYDECCVKVMQNPIVADPKFTLKIENNPIELLLAIQQLVKNPVCIQYYMKILWDTIKKWVTMKLYDGEELTDYKQHITAHTDLVKSMMGTRFLDRCI